MNNISFNKIFYSENKNDMDEYYRNDNLEKDDSTDELEAGKIKHCEVFDKCLDDCRNCIFKELYNTHPKPGADRNYNGEY